MKKIVFTALALCLLCGCSNARPVVISEQEDIESQTVNLPIGTAKQEDCQLCGSKSSWHYYKKLDSLGVITLANAQISDIEIFAYEEDGSLRDNSGYSTVRYNNEDDGYRGDITTMGDRGICDLTLSWDEDKFLNLKDVAPLYCKNCMKKITGMDDDWSDRLADKKRCPFALIDFTDGELYSLNGIVTARFIRDYYTHFEFGETEISGVIVYAPKRTVK